LVTLSLVYSLVANMIHVIIPPEDLEKINSERFRHHDPIVARHLHVLYCKSLELPHQEICDFVDISRRALVEVLKQYAQGGLAAVMQTKWRGKRFILDDHREIIEQHFRKHPPELVKVAAIEIEKLTGIKRGQTQIRTFLHKIGMKPRKVAGIPAKADPAKQEEFKKKAWSLP
jgi:transposase